MEMNFITYGIAALVPMIIGALWYGPLFGTPWMQQMGFTKDSLKGANMLMILLVSYLFSFMVALALLPIVNHQMAIFSTLAGEPGFATQTGEAFAYAQNFMETYGDRFRTFKHGALHGGLMGVFLVLPILTIQAIFERKKVKYIAINAGYWIVTLAVMGGIVCQWA